MQEAGSAPNLPSTESPSRSFGKYSCALCHRRKVRCDKKNPCTYCVTHHVPCVPVASAVMRPRKKRFPEAELLARLKRYEDALKGYGANLETLNNAHSSSIAATTPRKEAISTSAEEETLLLLIHEPGVEKQSREIEEYLQEESEGESEPGSKLTSYDNFYEAGSSALLFSSPGIVDLHRLHPAPVQIFMMWQAFLDNVHPILRVLHAPTIQQQILRTVSDLSGASPTVHALLFSIYSNAAISMRDDACLTEFSVDKTTLVNRYTAAAQYALQKAGFLRTSNLVVIQALVLHLVSIMKSTDPRSFLSLTAVAERIAKRNNLHRNTHDRGLSAFDKELRTRVWWQILLLELRAAEISAVGTSILSFTWDRKLPLNINESDLNFEIALLPQEHERTTDMTFCLIRCEILKFLGQIRATRGIDVKDSEFNNASVPIEVKIDSINDFDQHLQTKYLNYCDAQNPLHILARYYVKYSISKMKIAAYGPSMNGEKQESLMYICLEAIEAYSECLNIPCLTRFAWFLTACVPFLAYVNLFFNLRYRATGTVADRAWEAVSTRTDVLGRPRWLWALSTNISEPNDSPVQLALANMSVKAWEAREVASKDDFPLHTPHLIIMMREKLASSKKGNDMHLHASIASNSTGTNISKSAADQSTDLGFAYMYTGGMTNLNLSEASLLTPSSVTESSPPQTIPMDDEVAMWNWWNDLFPSSGVENSIDWN